MGHTKGEWKVTKSGNKNFDLAIVVEDGGSICHITKWFDAKGNAKLIAAAPDMLEALINIVDAQYDPNKTLANLNSEVKTAKELIKKATE